MTTEKYPTADEVAVAIVTACKACDEDPMLCVNGAPWGGRGRHYAAHALKHLFPDIPAPNLARVVGSNSPSAFWSMSRLSVQRGKFKWWSPTIVRQVIVAMEKHRAAQVRPREEPIPLQRAKPPRPRPEATSAPLAPKKKFSLVDDLLPARRRPTVMVSADNSDRVGAEFDLLETATRRARATRPGT